MNPAPVRMDDPSSTQSSQRYSNSHPQHSQKIRKNNVHGRKTYTAKTVKASPPPTLPDDAANLPAAKSMIDSDLHLHSGPAVKEADDTSPLPAAPTFDDDLHAMARAYLMGTSVGSSASVDYVNLNTMLTDAYADLDWVLAEIRDVDEAQFSLENMRLHRIATAMKKHDPDRAVLLQALSSNDRAWNMTRQRFQTRERHTTTTIEKLKNSLKAIEHAQLIEWEIVKHS
jgi:hypothetical protein